MENKYLLSPLHEAVKMGKIDEVERLLLQRVDLNPRDHRQWTPLHHASLQNNREIVDLLLRAGADPTLKTDLGGTYQDIQRLIDYTPLDLQKQIPVYIRDLEGHEKQMTVGDYKHIRHADYIDESIVTKEKFQTLWESPYVDPDLFEISEKYLSKIEEIAPPHYVQQVTENDFGDRLSGDIGYGLFAREKIAKGSPIGQYHGLWSTEREESAYSILNGPDALHYGNEIAFINDSFPNCTMIPIKNYKGLPLRYLMVALDDIEIGEQFCWNYGVYSQKKEHPYVILRPKALRSFVASKPLKNRIDDFILQASNRCIDFDTYSNVVKIKSILETPVMILWMILHKVIPIEVSYNLVGASLSQGIIPSYDESLMISMLKIAKRTLEENNEIAVQSVIKLTEQYPLSVVINIAGFK